MASSASSTSSDSNPFAAAGPIAISASTAQLINIKSHVPVTLDIGDSNFSTWRTFFLIAFRKFGLMDHIDGTVDSSLKFDDAEWLQVDTCIVSWLYSTLSSDLLSAVLQPQDDAYTAWTTICSQFLDNIVMRSTQARQKLHALCQGDMSVVKYCGQIKRIADTLRDVGAPLSDPEMVIALLGGLSEKFAHCAPTISASRPPMRFIDARSFLQQEEVWITNRAQKSISTTLLAASRSSGSSSNAPAASAASSPPSSAGGTNTSSDRPRKRKKQAGRGGGGAPPAPGAARGAPVAFGVHPWTGLVHAWPFQQAPNTAPGAGVLGSRPGVAPPQSLTAHHAPGGALPPELYQALTGLTLQPSPPSASDWVFDTGASTHMAGNAGSTQQGGAPPQ